MRQERLAVDILRPRAIEAEEQLGVPCQLSGGRVDEASESVPTSILDVKTQFGAKGDGLTDDSQAILNAIHMAFKGSADHVFTLGKGPRRAARRRAIGA